MRRNRQTSIGVLTCGLVLAVGAVVGATPASAASSPTELQSTVQAVQNAAAGSSGAGNRDGYTDRTHSCVDPAAAGSGLSCCSRLRPVERARWHAAAEPGFDDGDEHHGSVVSRGECQCADQRLLALRRHRGRRQQQLFNDLSRTERAGRPGRRQRSDHGAGQRHRSAERSGDRTRARQRLVFGIYVAGRGGQRGRAGKHLLGQCRSRREHFERLRHHRDERPQHARRGSSTPKSLSASVT